MAQGIRLHARYVQYNILTLKLIAMNPTFDLKGEHAAITIIITAMKKLEFDMRIGKFIDSYRIIQIIDFLHTFTENCHYEKEEKSLYPALLDQDILWTVDTINHLISEHNAAHIYINEIDILFQEYLSGNTHVIDNLTSSMIKYVELEENHIKIVDNVILPICEKIFDAEKLKSISCDFKKIQDDSVGHLKHQEYYRLLLMLYTEYEVISESSYY
jgi:hemerythrin-like domain-containing protein